MGELISMADSDEIYEGNLRCFITGWGRYDRTKFLTSDVLMEANLPVLTNSDCRRRFYNGIWETGAPLLDVHICAGDPEQHDVSACHGDSGGPLVCERFGAWK